MPELHRKVLDELVRDIREGCARPEWTTSLPSDGLCSMMRREGVLLLWNSLLQPGAEEKLSPMLRRSISDERLLVSLQSEQREQGIQRMTYSLDGAEISWCLIKGAAIVGSLYDYPHHRPMMDVDVLVSPAEFSRAQEALTKDGVGVVREHGQRSHEQNLEGQGFWIDLHQDLLGAGRSRIPLAEEILKNRVRQGTIWVPDDAGSFLSLAVHPVVTDYLTRRLIRLVDLDRWIRRSSPNWGECVQSAQRTGLSHAAWLGLVHCSDLFGCKVPRSVLKELRPSSIKRAYLCAWLARDPAGIFERNALLARAGFQLPLGDSLFDAYRSLHTLLRES